MKLSSDRLPHMAAFAISMLSSVALALGVLCLGGPAGVIPAAHAAPPAVNDLTPAADSAIAKQDWPQALKELDARIKAEPHDAQAKFKRAGVLARMGRDSDAIAAFTELTQLYPELPAPYNNLAVLYAKEGRYEEARAALETSVKANPSYGLAYENLGDMYLRLANAAYQRAIALDHASANARQRMADLQKIVMPPPAARPRARTQGAPATTQAAASSYTGYTGYTGGYTGYMGSYMITPYSTLDNPVFQFGGPTGSLGMPPYVAPLH